MLLIIASVPNGISPPVPDYKEDARVKLIRYILVDTDFKNMLDCPHNNNSFSDLIQFITQ